MQSAPFILLVNPWITDFAAYDLWSKPMGLLLLASLLRRGGCGVALVDCLDRHDRLTGSMPGAIHGKSRRYGTGKYPRERIQKPSAYAQIPRHYYRHGIHPESLRRRLGTLERPDLIWVTSIMTYWYPGVQQTIEVLREVFPETPVWLGGIYARLCPEHAGKNSGADEVVTVPIEELPGKIEATTGFALKERHLWGSLALMPPPALDLLGELDYAPLMTSAGCPLHCPYCASRALQPKWERRSGEAVFDEIMQWHRWGGVSDFAFYDDALLLRAEDTLKPALERLCRENVRLRFHTPNALHIRALSPEWCRLLRESGFTTLRLGLETTRADKQKEWGGKTDTRMFLSAVADLLAAGFSGSQIGVYLLCGLPGQSPEDVAEAIRVVQEAGAMPCLAEYSPLPGTPLWNQASLVSSFNLAEEPLYHNNTFFACRRPDFTYEDLTRLKHMASKAKLMPE